MNTFSQTSYYWMESEPSSDGVFDKGTGLISSRSFDRVAKLSRPVSKQEIETNGGLLPNDAIKWLYRAA